MLRIGTSGWVYNHWRGVFYPQQMPSRLWFSHYASVFDTVEVNNSFYRLPETRTFERWREQAPEGFLYTVKANRFITHMKKLKDPDESLPPFFERVSHLETTLGPILFQLPPHWAPDLPRFEAFLSRLPREYTHVIEFRNPGWLAEDVFRLMEQRGVAHCIHDMRPLQVPVRITSSVVYLRFHGDPLHQGDYPGTELRRWAGCIREWLAAGLDVYAYFNNDIGGYAINNARTLRDEVAS